MNVKLRRLRNVLIFKNNPKGELAMQDCEIEYTIMNVAKNGLTVTLNDGSRYEIKIGDSTKTSCWYATMHIKIDKDSEDEQFPFKLTSPRSPEIVRARLK